MATKAYNIRMEEGLKASMDEIAAEIGLTTATAFNVFAKRFVAERGFPFDVRAQAPTEEEFTAEMDKRFEEMMAGASHMTEVMGGVDSLAS